MWEGKPEEAIKAEVVPLKSSEDTVKEATSVHANGDVKHAEKMVTVNGIANGC